MSKTASVPSFRSTLRSRKPCHVDIGKGAVLDCECLPSVNHSPQADGQRSNLPARIPREASKGSPLNILLEVSLGHSFPLREELVCVVAWTEIWAQPAIRSTGAAA